MQTLGHRRTREKILKRNNLVFTNKEKGGGYRLEEVLVVYDFVGPAKS